MTVSPATAPRRRRSAAPRPTSTLVLVPIPPAIRSGWVTFNFQVTGGSWDPTTSDIVFRGENATTGQPVECWTAQTPNGLPANCLPAASAVPEPVTMTLLATGLASMGGAGLFRRRRNRNVVT